MGAIIYKIIIKLFFIIILLYAARNFFDIAFFWIVSFLAIVFFVIYPAYNSYLVFLETNETIINNSLCTSCKHFDRTAVLCLKYDKHITGQIIPCEGTSWEPKS